MDRWSCSTTRRRFTTCSGTANSREPTHSSAALRLEQPSAELMRGSSRRASVRWCSFDSDVPLAEYDVLTVITHGLRSSRASAALRPPVSTDPQPPGPAAVGVARRSAAQASISRASVLVTHAGTASPRPSPTAFRCSPPLPTELQLRRCRGVEAAGLGFAGGIPNRVTPLEVAEAVRCMIGTSTRRWIGGGRACTPARHHGSRRTNGDLKRGAGRAERP